MSKFTKLTFVAIFALLVISLVAVEARDYRRQEETTPTPSGGGDATSSPTPTGTGTDGPDTPPTDVPADGTPSPLPPPVDTGLPATGKASDIASLLNSAASKSGATPTPSGGSGGSGGSGSGSSGPATTPSSANKIEYGIFGIAIAALVSLFL